MPKIGNIQYRQFIDNGEIIVITEDGIKEVLSRIEKKHVFEARALVTILYLSGARPNEALKIRGKDVNRDGAYLQIRISGSKRGLTRMVYLKLNNPLVKEFYEYARSIYPDLLLFNNFICDYKKIVRFKTKNGELKEKEYTVITERLRYYFKKWFKDYVPPYYLRHNRFSKLSLAGASMNDILLLKGGKSIESVRPYIHLSKEKGKKIAGKIN